MFRDKYGIYILRASFKTADGVKITAVSRNKRAFKIYIKRFK